MRCPSLSACGGRKANAYSLHRKNRIGNIYCMAGGGPGGYENSSIIFMRGGDYNRSYADVIYRERKRWGQIKPDQSSAEASAGIPMTGRTMRRLLTPLSEDHSLSCASQGFYQACLLWEWSIREPLPGIVEKIPYLKELGIHCRRIECPPMSFGAGKAGSGEMSMEDAVNHLRGIYPQGKGEAPRINYWG